ncbi:F-box/kelch-repeat protein [Cardamine amara subsp. amara]|uniref:F-box/kelch-repeat protein n=1 Tax=Cardamine amara subsp. amara TaxID=228776 RepID=A0ABD1C1H6_CARAN
MAVNYPQIVPTPHPPPLPKSSLRSCVLKQFLQHQSSTKHYLEHMNSTIHAFQANVLYYYDVGKNVLRVYDLKEILGVVKGVELGLFEDGSWSCTESYGGNSIVFLQKVVVLTETTEIWCAEIAVERRKDGEIWGKVEWYDFMLGGNSWIILKCLAVLNLVCELCNCS